MRDKKNKILTHEEEAPLALFTNCCCYDTREHTRERYKHALVTNHKKCKKV